MYSMKIKRLIEADRPTDVKDKTEIDWDTMFDEPTSKGELSANTKSSAASKAAGPLATPKLKVGAAGDTRKATAAMSPTDAMRDMMSKINMPVPAEPDTPSQDVVPHEPITPENVPAVISKEIEMSDPTMVQPTWHAVANLPGNMSRSILTLGKVLFGAFTKTPTRDIVMIGNVGGQGPNSTKEVRSVAAWVVENGRDVDTAHMDFGATIPGYSADVKQYIAGGVRFMLVKDQFGDYIYSWPEVDSVGGAKQIEAPALSPHRSLSKRTTNILEGSAVNRISHNFIQFGHAKIEVTDRGIGWQAPGGASTLFYPDNSIYGDRRGEGRLSQMSERGVPGLIQPIFRDYLQGRIRLGDIDAVITRLRELERQVTKPAS
jgi:hypothetical protein